MFRRVAVTEWVVLTSNPAGAGADAGTSIDADGENATGFGARIVGGDQFVLDELWTSGFGA